MLAWIMRHVGNEYKHITYSNFFTDDVRQVLAESKQDLSEISDTDVVINIEGTKCSPRANRVKYRNQVQFQYKMLVLHSCLIVIYETCKFAAADKLMTDHALL